MVPSAVLASAAITRRPWPVGGSPSRTRAVQPTRPAMIQPCQGQASMASDRPAVSTASRAQTPKAADISSTLTEARARAKSASAALRRPRTPTQSIPPGWRASPRQRSGDTREHVGERHRDLGAGADRGHCALSAGAGAELGDTADGAPSRGHALHVQDEPGGRAEPCECLRADVLLLVELLAVAAAGEV
jgi:hypothetical protein